MLTKPVRRTSWTPWVLLALLLSGVAAYALMPASPLEVRATACSSGVVEDSVVASSVGTVEADQTAVVSSETPGRVVAIALRQGTVVRDGAVVTLDSAELLADRERVKCDIDTAGIRVAQARLRVDKVDAELRRLKGTDEAAWRIEALEKDLAAARSEVDILIAGVKALEAAKAVVELRLSKCVIRAPFDGTLVKLHVEIGESVGIGSRVFTVQGNPPFIVRAPVDEVDAARLVVGLEARVKFDALRERSFPGRLIEIRPSASTDQKNNRTVEVKVRIDDLPPSIVTGMSAHIELIIARRPEVMRLGTAHLREDHDSRERFVFVEEGGVARRRAVKTGLWNWEYTEILGGLEAKDVVVTRTVDLDRSSELKDGRRVKVKDGK